MAGRPLRFVHQLSREMIVKQARRVERDALAKGLEADAMTAGKAILKGSRSTDLLIKIALWKSHRRAALVNDNSEELIAGALAAAMSTASDRVAVVSLTSLDGVGLPMASAIMTCIYPDRFTVIDVRALDALGESGRAITPKLYDQYLAYCRAEAERLEVSLRTLDRALWLSGSPSKAAQRSSM